MFVTEGASCDAGGADTLQHPDGTGSRKCSGNNGMGEHSGDPGCKYGMKSSTTSGTTVLHGVTKYGLPPDGHTNEKPPSAQRRPIDDNAGDDAVTQNSVSSRSS